MPTNGTKPTKAGTTDCFLSLRALTTCWNLWKYKQSEGMLIDFESILVLMQKLDWVPDTYAVRMFPPRPTVPNAIKK